MRHSRRRVMREHYELYMRKHIFNGRYFERNMQIVMCVVLVVALVIGCVAIGTSADTSESACAEVNVKDALFGNNDVEAKSTNKEKKETAGNLALEASGMKNTVLENVDVTEAADVEINVAATEQSTESVLVAATEEATEAAVEEQETDLFDDRCIANVEDTLNIRMEPDSDSEFVGSMESGAIAVVEGTEGEWTKIKSGDVEGYVLTQYVLTGSVAASFAKDYVHLQGTILEDGVNIRTEQSTVADIVTILDKDAVVTVIEDPTRVEEASPHVEEESVENVAVTETATEDKTTEDTVVEETGDVTVSDEEPESVASEEQDDIIWLKIRLEDGQEGYVSSDYVAVDELYQIAVSKEELERQAAEEAARKAAEEEAARKEAEAKSASGKKTSGNTSYQGASITPIAATQAGECLGTFTITAYCGCPSCSNGSNRTASGTVPTQGRTIAADTSILPYGTQVVIGGAVYTVEDCGSGVRGNHIDIFFATHDQAVAFGRRTMQVFKY